MTTVTRAWLDELQSLVTNRLDLPTLTGRHIGAILGDVPSTYAKSPKLWNAAFASLGVQATYVPLDVPADRLPAVLDVLRSAERFLGGSVTVPYKQAIIPLLDGVDPLAERIGAVNVIARSPEGGRLTGYNTDGLGGLRALTDPMLPGSRAVITDLSRARVLLLGAGGAAQALAVYLWDRMTQGTLMVANRTRPAAEALCQRLQKMRPGRVSVVADADIPRMAPETDLIVNATTRGQAGIRKLADGRWTCLEPYSPLAAATPATVESSPGQEQAFWETWFRQSQGDIQRNLDASLRIMSRVPRTTICYDIIYAPLESVFLRQARWSGHPTLNGKEMNLIQAAEAFLRHVCPAWLTALGIESSTASAKVVQAMTEEWGR